ncbi:MAG: PSP1 C-terminal domain-containing protein [Isosphaeraceae bacterium]
MARGYLVRYGLMRHVGRFLADDEYDQGDAVVVRTHRGTELGEVLAATDPIPGTALILRAAGLDDLDQARLAALDQPSRFAACEQFFRKGVWPLELIDVEPLLDDRRTVLQYLGPHRLDSAGLVQAVRESIGLDLVLEPVGLDAEDAPWIEAELEGCGSCGSGGGCGSADKAGGGGCSGCAVKDLMGRKRVAEAHS